MIKAGQAVQPGQRVLGRWSNGGWWEAEVKQVTDDSVTFRWADGGASDVEIVDYH